MDSNNLTHIENESSPDLIGDFVNKIETMVASSNLKDRIEYNLDEVRD